MNNNRVVYGKYGTNEFPCPWCGKTRFVYVKFNGTPCTCALCGGDYNIIVQDNNNDELFNELIGEDNNATT